MSKIVGKMKNRKKKKKQQRSGRGEETRAHVTYVRDHIIFEIVLTWLVYGKAQVEVVEPVRAKETRGLD